VLGRRAASENARPVHVLSLVNHYSGLDASGGTNAIPWVGPILVRIPLGGLGGRPQSIEPIGALNMKWTLSRDTLQIEMTSVGHHAVLVIA